MLNQRLDIQDTHSAIIKFNAPLIENMPAYDGKAINKNKPIIQVDEAEALLFNFLAKSNHAIVLQNFTTTRWLQISSPKLMIREMDSKF